MVITLGLSTVLSFCATLAAVAALLLLGTWRAAGRPAYLAAWSGFAGCSAVGLSLQAGRDLLPWPLLALVATPLYILGWSLFWAGARRLRDAPAPAWAVALPPAAWYLAFAWPAFRADLEPRAAFVSLLCGLLAGAGGVEVLRLRGSAGLRRAAWPLGLLTLLFAGTLGTRVLLFLAGVPVAFGGLIFVLGSLLSIVVAFAGLALASIQAAERDAARAAEAARREAAALEAGRAEILRLHTALPAIIFHREAAADGTARVLYRGGDIEKVTGWPTGDLVKANDFDGLLAPGMPTAGDIMRAVLREGEHTSEWSMRTPEGGWRWLRTHARVLARRPDGGAEVVGYVQDITAERAAAEAARAAQAREAAAQAAARARIERLHAGLPAIVFHRDCDADGGSRLLYRGGDYRAVTGWPPSAFDPGADFRSFAAPDTPPFDDYIRAILRDGEASMDWRMRQPDGSWRWMRNYGTRFALHADGGGEVVGYVLDIDRERRAAEQAAAAAADLERVLDLSPEVVFRLRIAPDGGLTQTYLSRAIETLTGWPRERLTDAGSFHAILDAEAQQAEPEDMRALLREGRTVRELRLRHAAGGWVTVRASLAVVGREPDGTAEVIGFFSDITAERAAQAREAAAQAEARARIERLHAGLPAIVFHREVDPTGDSRLLYRGGDTEAVLGWQAGAIAAQEDLDALQGPEAPKVAETMRRILREGAATEEWRLRQPDGSWRWMRTTARAIARRPDGGAEVVGYLQDITGEREARAREEAALQEGREQMERLLTGVPALLFHRDCNPDGTSRLLYRGGDIAAVTGWPAATFEGAADLGAYVEQVPAYDFAEGVRQILRDGSLVFDWRMRQPAGLPRWMRAHSRVLSRRPDGGGEVVGYVLDVSAEYAAREREEAALQEGREQMERLLTGVPALLFHRAFEADGSSRLLYRGGDIETVTGWPAAELAKVDNLGDLAYPQPIPFSIPTLVSKHEGLIVRDWQMRQPDGSLRWMRTYRRLLTRRPDGGGDAVGYVLDVSAEYAAAEAARLAQEREEAARQQGRAQVERLLTGLPAVIFLREIAADGSYRLLYRGGDIEKVTGWPPETVNANDSWHALASLDQEANRQTMLAALRDGAVTVEWQLRRPDGSWGWMRSHVIRLFQRPDGSGEVTGYMLDITAEREAREREAAAIQEGRAQVERLLTGLPAVIFLRDVQPDGASRLLYRGGDITEVTGWPAEELAGLDAWTHLAEPGDTGFQRALAGALRDGEASVEWRFRRPDGRWSWARSHAVRLSLRPDGSGEVAGYMLNIDREREAAERARAVAEDLETTLAAAPLAVYRGRIAADGDFSRTYLSRGIERITGMPWETVNPPGGLRALLHPDDHRLERGRMRTLAQDGLLIADLRLRRRDGGWVWTRHTLVVIGRDQAGGVEMIGFIVDVSAERAAEAREAEARADLDRTLAAAPVAVFRGRVLPDGRLVRRYLSQGIATLTGIPWEEVNQAGGLGELIDWDGFGDRLALLDRLLREGRVSIDHRLRHAGGGWIEVRTTIAVLERVAERSAEVVGFMADVTAEREAQAQAAAAGRLAALGEMGTGLAHELKQPLATISLAAENALHYARRGNAAAAETRMERIVQQARRAADIIENLRRFARGADQSAPPVPVPLDQAVEGALSLVGSVLREAGIGMLTQLGTPPPVVLGQLVSLEQVLVNLLLNARDALAGRPPGAGRMVTIAAAAEGDMVRLTIADTGGGIPPDILPRLFEPFVSSKDVDRGTGLGLSICHGLVEAMGGTIEARNAAEGAVFTIRLPAAAAVAPAA